MNTSFLELLKLIMVLLAVIVGFTLTGIANNVLVKGQAFDYRILIKGLVKTLTACAGLIVIAYVCTIIDLSGLGFEPQTAITSGILVYSAKLIRNAFGLLGLSKFGKDEKEDNEPLLREKENNGSLIDNFEFDTNRDEGNSLKIEEKTEFEELDVKEIQNNEESNAEINPNAVG